MKGVKEAFIDAGEISQMLGIGMTKAYAIIKEYNAELEAKGYFTMRGKCPRKYFEQKIYGYEDYYNPDYEPQRNRSKVAEEMDYEAAVGDSVISEQDEVDIPPETNELSEDGAEIAENVMSDADAMAKETTDMVIKSVDAFVQKDMDMAHWVIKEDDVVDDLFNQFKQQLIKKINENVKNGEQATDMLMVAKYFERIGDHATNIAEWVIYSITGQHEN